MGKIKIKDWFSFFAPRFLALGLILGFIIRVVLIFHPLTVVDWGFGTWVKIFALGLLNDIAFLAIALVPAFIFYTFLTDDKYRRPFGLIFWGLFSLLTLYVIFFNDITDEYGDAAFALQAPPEFFTAGGIGFFSEHITTKVTISGEIPISLHRPGWQRKCADALSPSPPRFLAPLHPPRA